MLEKCKCYNSKQCQDNIKMRHEVTKDFTQNVKAKVMGCFWVIVKSPNKMKLKSAWQKAKEKEIKYIRAGCALFNMCFFVFVRVLYLPSLLKLLSDVTAFTKSGTSVEVLEPSQWARQTAPLPSIQIKADNKNAIPNYVTRKTKAHNIKTSERTVYQCVAAQPNGRWWHHQTQLLKHSLKWVRHKI